MEKFYIKPSVRIITLNSRCKLLGGSDTRRLPVSDDDADENYDVL
jgi:hypothetical protein